MRWWLVLLVACSRPSTHEELRRDDDVYASPTMWACRPDKTDDPCHGDLTTTVIAADGSRTRVAHARATDAVVDCFYIYPTVDLRLRAGNHTDFADLADIDKTVRAQIARFAEVCNVYAPLYRQVTLGTYRLSAAEQAKYVDVAYSDVAAAFRYYLAHADPKHQIAILGHSQGARMATRLLQDTFDVDPELRKRLVVGMPIGGREDTSTFKALRACTRDDERGCVIGYRTIWAGDHLTTDDLGDPPNGHLLCVAPAESLASTFLVDGNYISVRGLYHAQCVASADGRDALQIHEVREANDKRPALVDPDKWHGKLGLHIFDFQFPQDDLIALIKKKAG